MKKLALAISALLLLTACGSITSTNDSQGSSDIAYDRAESKIGLADASIGSPDQQLIQTASITLRVDDVAASSKEVTDYVASIQGRIDSKDEYRDPGSNEITSATFMVKVPTAQLDLALEKLKSFGDLEGFSQSAVDVTLQVIDLDARIKSLTTSISNLEKLLKEASSVADLLAAEAALAARQAELNGLQSQRTYLADQIDLSAIWVNILPKKSLTAVKPIGFVAGLEKGWDEIVKFANNLTTWTGLALPWIGLVFALLLVLKLVASLRRTKRKN
jgi:hypothetical protein